MKCQKDFVPSSYAVEEGNKLQTWCDVLIAEQNTEIRKGNCTAWLSLSCSMGVNSFDKHNWQTSDFKAKLQKLPHFRITCLKVTQLLFYIILNIYSNRNRRMVILPYLCLFITTCALICLKLRFCPSSSNIKQSLSFTVKHLNSQPFVLWSK